MRFLEIVMKIDAVNMTELSDLTIYEPFDPSPLRAWKLVEREKTVSIERHINIWYFLIGMPLLPLFAFFLAFMLSFFNNAYYNGEHEVLGQMFYVVIGISILFLIIPPLAVLWGVELDRKVWKSPRFVYDLESKTLRIAFFHCGDWWNSSQVQDEDDFIIKKSDCQKIILGWTSGYCAKYDGKVIVSPSGKKKYKRTKGTVHLVPGTQFYIIIQTNTGEWRKFILVTESWKRRIRKTMRILASYLDCETIERSMTYDQCCLIHCPEEPQ